jgi:hypothetical protein
MNYACEILDRLVFWRGFLGPLEVLSLAKPHFHICFVAPLFSGNEDAAMMYT